MACSRPTDQHDIAPHKIGRATIPFPEALRLAASIKQGTVTASLILRKLSAYPRQNSLALALREMGRMERSIFTLKWLQDPTLRRRVLSGLNKGEARNALARAVFFQRVLGINNLRVSCQFCRVRANFGLIGELLPVRQEKLI